ncbi:MAG: hypothetical protein LBH44_10615 [Treponema sp.]|jgi:hypothetical protein|nr:hypothetical protein [Treponema sp.]
MKISEKEVLRYLKHSGTTIDERTSALIEQIASELTDKTSPKNVYGIWDCRLDSNAMQLDSMTVNSQNLAGHLHGCRRIALMAVTLGTGADTLIRRYSVQDMEKAVIAHAVCAVMIEEYCDTIENEIAQKPEVSGLYHTTRFSPGYGDFDIVHQKDILRLLNCSSRIGLTLTNGYMLIPSKSVTAVIGFARETSLQNTEEKKENRTKCERCGDELCAFREAN